MNIGLIRGGQLGYMLIEAGMPYADHFFVLDSDPKAPCRNFCKDFVEGDFLDPEVVERFGQRLDAIIVEFEHVSLEGLRRLEEKGIPVYPSTQVLGAIQDKGLQKQFFKDHDLPTSDFEWIDSPEQLDGKLPAVLKRRKGGYDGKGVIKVDNQDELPVDWTSDLLWEELVPIQKELSMVVARDQAGNMKTYPTVEMVFHEGQNMLDLLLAPARVSDAVLKEAEQIAQKTAEAYGIVGILAVELFLTTSGDLLINEVAPRVHNSGHLTQESAMTSQFEQLIRIVHGLPLGDTSLRMPTAMVNLVGHPDYQGPAVYEGLEEVLSHPHVHLHLYGKAETRPHRKMGHVTVMDSDLEKAIERARMSQKLIIIKS